MSEINIKENALKRAEELYEQELKMLEGFKSEIEEHEKELRNNIKETAVTSEKAKRKRDMLVGVLYGIVTLIIAVILLPYTVYVSGIFVAAAFYYYRKIHFLDENSYKKRKTYFEDNRMALELPKLNWRRVNTQALVKQGASISTETENATE